ncbi:MAG: trehalase family glycosidase, partial [Gemmatimonadales bacterium]
MNRYLWDPERGLFLDYDLVNRRREVYISAVAFYPLWSGLATPAQAESIVRTALPALEEAGGIVASTEASRGPLSEGRPARQWDYPNGWVPHQMLALRGLLNYGYVE